MPVIKNQNGFMDVRHCHYCEFVVGRLTCKTLTGATAPHQRGGSKSEEILACRGGRNHGNVWWSVVNRPKAAIIRRCIRWQVNM